MDELEWQTRRDRINKRLQALSRPWTIISSRKTNTTPLTCHAVEEYPTANGPADYALFVNGRLLGIIEAKKVKVSPQNVLEQAKRYAKGAFNSVGTWNGFKVPFLYATNGESIWFVDIRHPNNLARKINAFHTPDALAEFFDADVSGRYDHLQHDPPAIKGLRPYQQEAVEAIENAIAARKRAMLSCMSASSSR